MSEEDRAAEHSVILRAVDSIIKPYPLLEAGESAEEFISIIAALRSRKINRYRSVMDLFLRRNGQPSLVFRELHVNKYPEPTSLRGHSRIEIIGLHLGRDSPQTRRGPKLPREFINALRSEMAQYLHTQFVDMKMLKASYPSRIEVIFRTESAATLFVAAFCKVSLNKSAMSLQNN